MGSSRRLHVVWIIHLLFGCSVAASSSGESRCDIQPLKSLYISSYNKEPVPVRGCSAQSSSSGHGVYIVNVLRTADVASAVAVSAKLTIVDDGRADVLSNPLLILLNSADVPVMWDVQIYGLESESLKFIVSNGSRVKIHNDEVVKVTHKKHLPTDSARLIEWMNERNRHVTSLAEIELRQPKIEMILTVANDLSAVDTCLLTETSRPVNIEVASLQWVDHLGCDSNLQMEREVYGIQLLRASHSANLMIELKSGEDAVEQDVVLILKGPPNTSQWNVLTSGMTGSLLVVTNNQVNTSKATGVAVSVRSEQLPNSGLAEWIFNQYGKLRSYTLVQQANTFHVFVKGRQNEPVITPTFIMDRQDVLRHLVSSSSALDVQQEQSSTVRTSSRPVISLPFGRPASTSFPVKQLLKDALEKSCSLELLVFALRKDVVNSQLAVSVSRLSLGGLRDCVATENQTHYVLSATVGSCGMQELSTDDAAVYVVQIVLQWPRDEAMPAKLMSDEWTVNDDTSMQVSFDNYCKISLLNPTTEVNKKQSELVELHVYNEMESVNLLETPVTIENTAVVFVEVTAGEDSGLGTLTEECWLSRADNQHAHDRYYIIKKRCPVGSAVELINSSSSEAQKFKLTLSKSWEAGSPTAYLHCLVSVCDPGNDAQSQESIEQCADLKSYCKTQPSTSSNTDSFSKIVWGPIHFSNVIQKADLPDSVGGGCIAVTNKPCVIGLESGAVVGIAFTSFAIGCFLTAMLWFIHYRTDPRRSLQAKPLRTNDVLSNQSNQSGTSTPNSHVPMTLSA